MIYSKFQIIDDILRQTIWSELWLNIRSISGIPVGDQRMPAFGTRITGFEPMFDTFFASTMINEWGERQAS